MFEPMLIDIPELRGERVLVRPYRAGDGQAMYEAVSLNREYLRRYMIFWDQHQTPDESELFIRKVTARFILREDLPMGIWHLDTGKFLGGTGLHRINWNNLVFEIGYWIRGEFEGQGFVTETVKLLTTMAFDHLSANRVLIRTAVDNFRSKAIPQRLGFVYEGVARQELRLPSGEIADIDVFALTKKDWEQRRSR